MSRRVVYIAGPISKGDLAHNINQATAAFVELARAGFAPLCPHWSAFSGGAHRWFETVYALASAGGCGLTHAEWLAVDLAFVERADAVLRLPGESTGADIETAHAAKHGKPVFNSVAEVIAWGEVEDSRHCRRCGVAYAFNRLCVACQMAEMAQDCGFGCTSKTIEGVV